MELSNGDSAAALQQRRGPRRRMIGIEERRRQNRVAAARHRQRQQERLETLERREAMLQQQADELEAEVAAVRSNGAGHPSPPRDPFTAAVLEMLETADLVRSSLDRTLDGSTLAIQELQGVPEQDAQATDDESQ
ncbi:hypothetical protein H4R21_001022 [Coemansia helicoidea]|uniref:Uncharacterized protein n=1 Tax=Coemansia helicoidea TaxID=1286919 RepID=A0ACC1LDK9_9FUNG|nr:hypothetical protein H4R21_001022 [Coemansia helicoidea]